MQLKLKNIGMIKEADIAIDGLTVIAGENDTGKSTVGKVLYILIKTLGESVNTFSLPSYFGDKYIVYFNRYVNHLFKEQISEDGVIDFRYANNDFRFIIESNNCKSHNIPKEYKYSEQSIDKPLLIETPFIWNIHSILKTVRNLKAHDVLGNIDFEMTPIIEDLYFALTTKMKKKEKLALDINEIIGGKFEEDNLGDFVFNKNGKKIELINTAMGIKSFGLLQILEEKNHFYKGQILILDEPEVHLHPKWQLKMAEVIVELIKNGVKVVVNSHSPYMIEALERYSEKANIPFDFYLAEDGVIEKVEDSNSATIAKIFKKLSAPFDEFDKMDSEILQGG